jgi:hypothetical protein
MAKYSKMMMGKEVGDAKVYAPPHTMKGEKVAPKENPGSGPNMSRADTVNMTVLVTSTNLLVVSLRHLVSRCAVLVRLLKA